MSIEIQCPHCFKDLRVKDQFAGRVLNCPKCKGAMQIPELDEDEPAADNFDDLFNLLPDAPPEPPTPPQPEPLGQQQPPVPAEEEGWSTPQWDEPAEAPLPDPHSPFPEARDPTALPPQPQPVGQSDSGVIAFGTLLDFALDAHLISYGLQWMGIAFVGIVVAGLLLLLPFIGIVLSAGLLVLTLVAMGLGLSSGVGHLTACKLRTGHTPPVSEAWDVFFRRCFSLSLGVIGLGLLQMLIILLVGLLIAGLSFIPLIGPVIGGLLLIPTFVGVIFAFLITFTFFLLPVIIGVEDCTALQAHSILRRLVAEMPFFMLSQCFAGFLALCPACLLTLVLTAVPLAIATALCSTGMLQEGPGLLSIPLMISGSAIVLSSIALGMVLSYVCLAMVYCQCRGRALVTS